MSARVEIHRLTSRVSSAFDRARLIQDLETQADAARYLCVLVSGLLERAVQIALLDFARRTASPQVQRFVAAKTHRLTNLKAKKLRECVAEFDPGWALALDAFLVDDLKDAVDSVVANRHLIAHGQHTGISLGTMDGYFTRVKKVIEEILRLTSCE